LTATRFATGFQRILNKAGQKIKITYFNQTVGSVWDDDTTLTTSGTLWLSGIVLPIGTSSDDSILIQQGRLLNGDKKLYIHGSIALSTGSVMQVKFQVGSPIGSKYSLLSDGTINTNYAGTDIYKRVYIRLLTTGSIIGESGA